MILLVTQMLIGLVMYRIERVHHDDVSILEITWYLISTRNKISFLSTTKAKYVVVGTSCQQMEIDF